VLSEESSEDHSSGEREREREREREKLGEGFTMEISIS